jgi:ferredoxin
MQIEIDTSVCQGHGQCAHLVPEVFRMTAAGVSEVIPGSVQESLFARIDEAVRSCPVGAITARD